MSFRIRTHDLVIIAIAFVVSWSLAIPPPPALQLHASTHANSDKSISMWAWDLAFAGNFRPARIAAQGALADSVLGTSLTS